jgi:excisionase family DNA binding protein
MMRLMGRWMQRLRHLDQAVILRMDSRSLMPMHQGEPMERRQMVATQTPPRGPVMSEEHERPALAEADALLRERDGNVYLTDERGNRVELPATAARLVHQVVRALARGNPAEVHVLPKELTIQHAAEILDLRPQDVVRLIDEGEIPSVQSDDLRRIRFQDVMAYKPKRDAERRAGLDELTRLSQEMGLYDLEYEKPRRDSMRGPVKS